ncbi:DNA helicase MCM9-like [Zophobas morio]|uniref:DNA helicase MCM9-like n=1 Tax=Zophobas morio TaxID=2755281 RepID=UPI00308398EA
MVNKLICLQATVVRVSASKLLESRRSFRCLNCSSVFYVNISYEQNNIIPKPKFCPQENCTGVRFLDMVEANSGIPEYCCDYQTIKVQEQTQNLDFGCVPHTISVVLEEDLVDSCKAGDDVLITGILLQRWDSLRINERCAIELFIKANSLVQVQPLKKECVLSDDVVEEFRNFWQEYENRPLLGRNIILSSFCPQLYGMYIVKLSILCVLIGGITRIDKGGTRIRGESHLLLVGDPGTGKSQLLKYASKLVPRAVLTSGTGITTAGLTVAAMKESGEWQLEAGALVLADGGLCCIDEFASMSENDRTTIHEAMEQQTLSVAKAGLVCKLNTRAIVLAATNPKGKYDIEEDITINTALSSPLLSRFDLVTVMLDKVDLHWDREVSDHVLKNAGNKGKRRGRQWSLEKLKSYISFVKKLEPQMTAECEKVLKKYYQLQRQSDLRNAARTTLRLLESLVRLAQAHARLMCKTHVELSDAVMAVWMMESSMHGAPVSPEKSPLRSLFPDDPDKDYFLLEVSILERLDVTELLPAEVNIQDYMKETFNDTPILPEITLMPLPSENETTCYNTCQNQFLGALEPDNRPRDLDGLTAPLDEKLTRFAFKPRKKFCGLHKCKEPINK